MRLPTLNAEQRRNEAARERNERLYQHYLDGTMMTLAITLETVTRMQSAASSNGRRFWTTRGFKVCTQVNADRTILSVWLVQGTKPKTTRLVTQVSRTRPRTRLSPERLRRLLKTEAA